MIAAAPGAVARPVLHDPVTLNIGVNCQWQARCMALQRQSMKSALYYVASARPASAHIQACNRNAGRGGARVDWTGFDHCIRNAAVGRSARPPKRNRFR